MSLTDVLVSQPIIADLKDLILQLMQLIPEMRVEMQMRQDLPPPGFAGNTADGRPPIYFPSSNINSTQNQQSRPVPNPSVIDMNTQNPQ